MTGQNPWREFPHDIYEKHMGHENVRQLEMLSRITDDQLRLVSDIHQPVIALLGITSGNGLCHVMKRHYKAIIGLDINEEFLKLCRNQYGHIPELKLYQIDLMVEKDRAADLLQAADLVMANMVVEHIYPDNFMEIAGKLTKPIVSVTIQFNPDGEMASSSGFEPALEEIVRHGRICEETSLAASMRGVGYTLIGRTEYHLPNEKIFIRLDFQR
ncbi:MAG: class I SAM-dependent methyltransferase [Acidobacteriaceae bacterium]|nr:class I SAM-dependent methyltransferase [Acidobacteriaceae bacterium]